MNKTELETIALACLERLDAEAKEAHRTQDERIMSIEARVEDYERQLTRLSASVRSLQPLADGLNSMLANGGVR
jgi:heme oxygenase